MSETEPPRIRPPRPPHDWVSTWTVLVSSAAMGFLASLALSMTIGFDRLADAWTSDLERVVTVTLPAGEADAETYERLLAALTRAPNVIEVEPVSLEAVAADLGGMLAADPDLAATLPLSRMVDVTFDGAAREARAELEARLAAERLPATIHGHEAVTDRLAAAAAQVRGFALSALSVIAIAATLMVALACTSALAAHGEMVDLLRLIGARDAFIASAFERPLQMTAFLGSAAGAAVAFAAIASPLAPAPPELTTELAPLLPDLRPSPSDWPNFVAIPLVFALIATAAARLSVMVALRREER